MEGVEVSEFVSRARAPAVSVMPLEMMARRMGVDVMTHDFRSSFRNLGGNETLFSRKVAEHALAHVIGDKAEHGHRESHAAV